MLALGGKLMYVGHTSEEGRHGQPTVNSPRFKYEYKSRGIR